MGQYRKIGKRKIGRDALAILVCLLLELVTASSRPATAQSGVYTPKAGSPERKAILNALRVPVEKDLKMPVVFVITHPQMNFRVQQDWAFVVAEFRHTNGTPMGERYYAETNNSDLVPALLHRTHGRWSVVTHDTGAVDVAWPEWSQQYHAPPALFPKSP